ncbi:hypothetical protein EYF80_018655 [Liparis tanakae]|uniref:Uncharacterized protein n=1 Tax=Liparis tanakae TaxID=230148 RepID=A0A4Z2I0M3_9TELE|nr:hypothetical protein EYF80_018655 [Liparis tanakae]
MHQKKPVCRVDQPFARRGLEQQPTHQNVITMFLWKSSNLALVFFYFYTPCKYWFKSCIGITRRGRGRGLPKQDTEPKALPGTRQAEDRIGLCVFSSLFYSPVSFGYPTRRRADQKL